MGRNKRSISVQIITMAIQGENRGAVREREKPQGPDLGRVVWEDLSKEVTLRLHPEG